MEIKNKLIVTRGEGGGIVEGRRGRCKQGNTNRGLMGMVNIGGVAIGCGSEGG